MIKAEVEALLAEECAGILARAGGEKSDEEKAVKNDDHDQEQLVSI